MTAAEDRFVFYVEWFDAQADLIRRYMLTYFPRDDTIEMYDTKNHRPFLKRSEYPGVSVGDLYIGATVTVHSRQLKIIEYADVHTRKAMESKKSRTLALIKPDAYNHIGKILSMIHANGFVVARLKMVKMTKATSNRAKASSKVGSEKWTPPPGMRQQLKSAFLAVRRGMSCGGVALALDVPPGVEGRGKDHMHGCYFRLYAAYKLASNDVKAVEREVAAALESVFPRVGLRAFVSLTPNEKGAQLQELASIVMGIRLFNARLVVESVQGRI